LATEQDVLSVRRNRDLRVIERVVGEAVDVIAIEVRGVELGPLRVVAGDGVITGGQLGMIACRGPDDALPVGEEERAGIVAAVIDAADVGAIDVQRADVVGIVTLALGRSDDPATVGRKVELHRRPDVGNAVHWEFVAWMLHVEPVLELKAGTPYCA
jgi:hypothetical protein